MLIACILYLYMYTGTTPKQGANMAAIHDVHNLITELRNLTGLPLVLKIVATNSSYNIMIGNAVLITARSAYRLLGKLNAFKLGYIIGATQ